MIFQKWRTIAHRLGARFATEAIAKENNLQIKEVQILVSGHYIQLAYPPDIVKPSDR